MIKIKLKKFELLDSTVLSISISQCKKPKKKIHERKITFIFCNGSYVNSKSSYILFTWLEKNAR